MLPFIRFAARRNPPKSQKSPEESVQVTEPNRALGILAVAAMPSVPYVAGCPSRSDPPIQVHSPALYFQRSLSEPSLPAESRPVPPKSQRFPNVSVQVAA